MTKSLSAFLLMTSLAYLGSDHGASAKFRLSVDGSRNQIEADAFGQTSADLRVDGDGNDLDVFAGPCGGHGAIPIQLNASHSKHVIIPRCR